MNDENGNKVSEKEIIKVSLDMLAEACCLLFETESPEGHALAFMVDSAMKYGQVIYRDDNVLSAAADYTGYESRLYEEKMGEKK